jgi:hypothetical protein
MVVEERGKKIRFALRASKCHYAKVSTCRERAGVVEA